VPRTDGIAVQSLRRSPMHGYGEDDTGPDRAESEEAIGILAELYTRFGRRI